MSTWGDKQFFRWWMFYHYFFLFFSLSSFPFIPQYCVMTNAHCRLRKNNDIIYDHCEKADGRIWIDIITSRRRLAGNQSKTNEASVTLGGTWIMSSGVCVCMCVCVCVCVCLSMFVCACVCARARTSERARTLFFSPLCGRKKLTFFITSANGHSWHRVVK